jgi:hypothetical protein
MKKLVFFLLLLIPFAAQAQSKAPPSTLRGVLMEQLHTTHDNEDWFVPANIAVAGLTAEQAKWSPGKGQPLGGAAGLSLVVLGQPLAAAVQRREAGAV